MNKELFITKLGAILIDLKKVEESYIPYFKSEYEINFNSPFKISLLGKPSSFNMLFNFETLYSYDWSGLNRLDWSAWWERNLIWAEKMEVLKLRDNRRAILGTLPFANNLFKTIFKRNEFNFQEDTFVLNLDYLQDENPFKKKYNKISIGTKEKKFECLRDYINENSFATDSANIGWMSGATDFLQLYNCINNPQIIEPKNKCELINLLFDIFLVSNFKEYSKAYKSFIDKLIEFNERGDLKLSRLYNRLHFVFSFILNNLHPKIFPIYFSKTREVLSFFWKKDYQDVCEFYKSFLDNNKQGIKEYKNLVIWKISTKILFNNDDYLYKQIGFNNGNLLDEHIAYRFFQDTMWLVSNIFIDYKNLLKILLKINSAVLLNQEMSIDMFFENYFKRRSDEWYNPQWKFSDYPLPKLRLLLEEFHKEWIIELSTKKSGSFRLITWNIPITF